MAPSRTHGASTGFSRSFSSSTHHRYHNSRIISTASETSSSKIDQEALTRRLSELKDSNHLEEAERILKGLSLPLDDWTNGLLDVAAQIEFALNNFRVALEYSLRLLKRIPKDAPLLTSLIAAYSYTMLGNTDVAVELVLIRLGYELEKDSGVLPKNTVDLVNGMSKLKAVKEGQVHLLNLLGWIFSVQGNKASAIGMLSLSATLKNNQKTVLLDCIGLLTDKEKHQDTALLTLCKQASSLFPDDLDILEYHLRALSISNEHQKVIDTAEAFENAHPKIPNLPNRLAIFKVNALQELQQDSSRNYILGHYSDATELKPHSTILEILEIGRFHLRSGTHRGHVLSHVMEISKKNPLSDRDTNLLIAFAIEDANNLPAAIGLLDQAIKTRPFHTGYKAKRATLAALHTAH